MSDFRLTVSMAELAEAKQELNEMKEVLAWASENVWSANRYEGNQGGWCVISKYTKSCKELPPTLYQALLCAWKARGEK